MDFTEMEKIQSAIFEFSNARDFFKNDKMHNQFFAG